jgi:hypothetical protein
MPGYDRTGPSGFGPRSGKGFGKCGRIFGQCGRGFGFRYPRQTSLTKSEEKKILEEELKDVEEEKKEIKKRIEELK